MANRRQRNPRGQLRLACGDDIPSGVGAPTDRALGERVDYSLFRIAEIANCSRSGGRDLRDVVAALRYRIEKLVADVEPWEPAARVALRAVRQQRAS